MKYLSIVLLTLFSIVAHAQKNIVNFYNWANYAPKSVIQQFEKETGIKVNYSEYDSNETLYTKLKTTSQSGYDLIVPSNYFVDRMRNQNMLEKLDKTKLPNLKNINPRLLNPTYDPGNNYSVPYLWGATGIVINTKYHQANSFTKWGNFWQPAYKNQLLISDDLREVFAVALIQLGYSINDTDPAHIKQAYEKLQQLMPNIKLFNSDATINTYVDEDATVGMGFSGDLYNAMQENKNLRFIYPLEGFALSIDNLAIPKHAPHLENAYKLFNFLLRPDIAARISQSTGFPTPNLKAIPLLPVTMQQNPVVNPDLNTLKRGSYLLDVGPASEIYEKYWELLKTGG